MDAGTVAYVGGLASVKQFSASEVFFHKELARLRRSVWGCSAVGEPARSRHPAGSCRRWPDADEGPPPADWGAPAAETGRGAEGPGRVPGHVRRARPDQGGRVAGRALRLGVPPAPGARSARGPARRRGGPEGPPSDRRQPQPTRPPSERGRRDRGRGTGRDRRGPGGRRPRRKGGGGRRSGGGTMSARAPLPHREPARNRSRARRRSRRVSRVCARPLRQTHMERGAPRPAEGPS